MTIQFASLGSGSHGNSTLVQVDDTLLLVDAGFSAKAITERMLALGVNASELTAILVSHEHSDHIKGVAVLARKHNIPVWMTRGTYRKLKDKKIPQVEFIHPHGCFRVGDAKISPFPIPHDAAEPCQFIVGDGKRRVAVATDMGFATEYVVEQLKGVDALLLEANYDGQMLVNGSYPLALRKRIDGNYGHLSNDQSAALAAVLEHGGLQQLCLGHLSENNNTPETALGSVANRLRRASDNVHVLKRYSESPWFSVA